MSVSYHTNGCELEMGGPPLLLLILFLFILWDGFDGTTYHPALCLACACWAAFSSASPPASLLVVGRGVGNGPGMGFSEGGIPDFNNNYRYNIPTMNPIERGFYLFS